MRLRLLANCDTIAVVGCLFPSESWLFACLRLKMMLTSREGLADGVSLFACCQAGELTCRLG